MKSLFDSRCFPLEGPIGSLDHAKLVYLPALSCEGSLDRRFRSCRKGPTLIAVQGDPLTDITILRQVKSVMKGSVIVVDTFHTPAN